MLYIMRGTSCSGKSTIVHNNFDDKNSIFSSDDFRERLLGNRQNQAMNKLVFEKMYEMLDIRLANKPMYTVYDATNLRLRDCSTVIELCKKHQEEYTIVSIIPPSIEELKQRNIKRNEETGFFVPESVLEKHYDRYFACMGSFINHVENHTLGTFIEIAQTGEVISVIPEGE